MARAGTSVIAERPADFAGRKKVSRTKTTTSPKRSVLCFMAGVLVLFFSLHGSLCTAQHKVVRHERVLWFHLSERISLNERWSLLGAVQYRHFIDRGNDYHWFFTAGLGYEVQKGLTLGAGFTNLNIHQPVDGEPVLVPELRPYQSVQFSLPIAQTRLIWRGMVEERFFRNAAKGELIAGYTYFWRFRHKFQIIFPLLRSLEIELGSEVMFQAGNTININVFDQHLGIIQLHYPVGKLRIGTGYMHWFFQTANNRHEHRHTWVIGLNHRL